MTKFLAGHFRSAWRRVGTFTVVKRGDEIVQKVGGNVAIYFCTPEFEVVHAVLGNMSPGVFLKEARWAVELSRKLRETKGEERRRMASIAHGSMVSELSMIEQFL